MTGHIDPQTSRTRRQRPAGKSAPGVPATAKGRTTRAALVRAAREVFERDGFLNARITDIAATAKVSHGTFYTYFQSKEEVFADIAQEVLLDMLDLGAPTDHGHDDPYVMIEQGNRAYLEAYRRNSRMMAVLHQAAAVSDDVGELRRQRRTPFWNRIERSILRLQQDGTVSTEINARYAAAALGSMVSSVAFTCFVDGERLDFDTAVEQLTFLWANALGIERPPWLS